MSRIESISLVEVHYRLLDCESKLEDYDSTIMINVGGNGNNPYNFTTTVTNSTSSIGFNVNFFKLHLLVSISLIPKLQILKIIQLRFLILLLVLIEV